MPRIFLHGNTGVLRGCALQVCHHPLIHCCVTSGQLDSFMSPTWSRRALHLRPLIGSDETTGTEVTSPLIPSPSWPEQQRAPGARRDPVDSTRGSMATCTDPHNSKAHRLGSQIRHLLNLYLSFLSCEMGIMRAPTIIGFNRGNVFRMVPGIQ